MPKQGEFAQKVTKITKGLSSSLHDDLGNPDGSNLPRFSLLQKPQLERWSVAAEENKTTSDSAGTGQMSNVRAQRGAIGQRSCHQGARPGYRPRRQFNLWESITLRLQESR
jgi:hypothetical protein